MMLNKKLRKMWKMMSALKKKTLITLAQNWKQSKWGRKSRQISRERENWEITWGDCSYRDRSVTKSDDQEGEQMQIYKKMLCKIKKKVWMLKKNLLRTFNWPQDSGLDLMTSITSTKSILLVYHLQINLQHLWRVIVSKMQNLKHKRKQKPWLKKK